ncbi:glycerol-3-phosphate dehydrogenase [Stomatohabitans albus]|uniref:NAD(P)H-dependent glycerol-3-phosphate dehydrogenase n=1 Tax=Stomatohabitans albus TaxID=3110766 RepID=UPI00300CD801
MATITILGAGVMASALSVPLADNGHTVRLVGTHLDDHIIDSLQSSGMHPVLELSLPAAVEPFHFADAAHAFESTDVVMNGTNSFGVEWIGNTIGQYFQPGMKFLSITKGMRADDDGTLYTIPQALKRMMQPEDVQKVTWNAIVGPSIAGELAVRHQTCVVFCGEDNESLQYLADLFRTDYYHIWTSTDFVGYEVGAAFKNVYAFAMGLARGLLKHEGKEHDKYVMFNYEAAVFAQAQTELRQWVEFLGGNPTLADGLGGVGDMFVTSMGGRNVRAATYVGSGMPFSKVVNGPMKGITLEGVAAIEVVGKALERLTDRGIVNASSFPLCRHLYNVVVHDGPFAMPWDLFYQTIE